MFRRQPSQWNASVDENTFFKDEYRENNAGTSTYTRSALIRTSTLTRTRTLTSGDYSVVRQQSHDALEAVGSLYSTRAVEVVQQKAQHRQGCRHLHERMRMGGAGVASNRKKETV